ncbi:DUF3795 domain-containing protein [Zongyangia sp. HA2173]|uniref:DUF3795 domain-containing protein n=1 Tax=Zongyangia sp. HA2173 TaxID=3133035 RepID=UPI00315E53E7
MMEKVVSSCGIICSDCIDFGQACAGCRSLKGQVSWASYLGFQVCPLYDCCVNKKGLAGCGGCNELPCQKFYDIQDPSTTREDHLQAIRERVALLKEQR